MKNLRIGIAAAVGIAIGVAATLGVLAFSEAADAHELVVTDDMVEANARIDALVSSSRAHSDAIDDIYTLLDELKARLDAQESSAGGLSAAVDDIYAILDVLAPPE